MGKPDEARYRVWREGYDAGVAGKSDEDCPYARGTLMFDDWQDGWNEAAYDGARNG